MDINAQLAALCTGTEVYHQLKHHPQVVLTDGGASAIALQQPITFMVDALIELSQVKGSITELKPDDIQFWKCRMNRDKPSELSLGDGNYNVLFRTEFTPAPFLVEDLSLDVWAAWSMLEDKDVRVFYLPSEH